MDRKYNSSSTETMILLRSEMDQGEKRFPPFARESHSTGQIICPSSHGEATLGAAHPGDPLHPNGKDCSSVFCPSVSVFARRHQFWGTRFPLGNLEEQRGFGILTKPSRRPEVERNGHLQGGRSRRYRYRRWRPTPQVAVVAGRSQQGFVRVP